MSENGHSIESIAQELEASGHDAGTLHELQEELDCLETPPGFWSRITRNTREAAARHWGFVLGEVQESKEAAGILGKLVTDGEDVSAADKDKLRCQLLDLLRVVPAGILAAANAALPLPCTSLATPWLLHRLGVMPSHWREAHLLDSLQKEVSRLRAEGCEEQADALEDIRAGIEHDAEERDRVEHDARLLTHWDANRNGVWDEGERAAYSAAVVKVASQIGPQSGKRAWYLLHEGGVFGPVRLSNFLQEEHAPDLLVCWEGESGWVALSDVLGDRVG